MLDILIKYIWFVAPLLTAIFLFIWRYTYNFHWFNFWYGVPLVGPLATHSKNTNCESGSDWSDAEKELCTEYRNFIHYPDEAEFKNNLVYLHKAADGGRIPTPIGIKLFLLALVVAEGLGFSYMLGSWMAMEGSEDTHKILMWAIVFVLSGLLMWLTHAAGHQLYRTNLIKHCLKKRGAKRGEGGEVNSIPLFEEQSKDDGQPSYMQTLNRVGDRGGYGYVITAGLFIVAVAILSTWMRFSHMDDMLSKETIGVAVSGDPFSALPSELGAPQVQADQQAAKDIKSAKMQEGGAAFIMLALIFVVTQIVGVGTGYKYGFAGEKSVDAYEGTRGFSSYRAVREYYKPRIQIAEARLKTLQKNLAQQQIDHTLPLNKKFIDYLKLEASEDGYAPDREHDTSSVIAISSNKSALDAEQRAAQTVIPDVASADNSKPREGVKFCTGCGNSIAAASKFCGDCGLKVA